MGRGGFAQGRGVWVSALACALGLTSCSPHTGKGDAAPTASSADAGHGSAPHKDASVLLPGIKGPPDAQIIHPGEGGIRAKALGSATKIDLLFMVDDSGSMGDKHDVLKAAIPDLLNRFVNPVCIDKYGRTNQPTTADAACPVDMNRQFAPVRDIHIGVITSSLGGPDDPNAFCPAVIGQKENDGAHFAGTLARASNVPTSPSGFLVWDPDQKASPPGQKDVAALVDSFRNLIDAVGQEGCGLESQLEAWYRLLVDPEPPIGKVVCTKDASPCGPPDGIDHTVLDQRAAFLRPDSLLVLIMLTDENDCSMTDLGKTTLGTSARPAPRASSACATNPDDPCCYPCAASNIPSACPQPDSACAKGGLLMGMEDQSNLRCFDGKRRYGFDPLQPVQRYIDALTKPMLVSRSGKTVENPLFAGGKRTPADLFVVGMVGVPWQDVATDDTLKSQKPLQLKSAKQLRDGNLWNVILGDPGARVPPTNALMKESVDPRTGQDPVTGDALAPPTAGLLANPINGHERNIPSVDDLEYSCIFPLPAARTCYDSSNGCECYNVADGAMNPVCQDPTGAYTSTQRYAKAYPSPRVLQVLKGVGDSGVIASICPKNMTDPSSEDYGYRPIIGTLIEDVAPKLIR